MGLYYFSFDKNYIYYIALSYGIHNGVSYDDCKPGNPSHLGYCEASTDTLITALNTLLTYGTGPSLSNSYFNDNVHFSRASYSNYYLTTRLEAQNVKFVKDMIDYSLYAEKYANKNTGKAVFFNSWDTAWPNYNFQNIEIAYQKALSLDWESILRDSFVNTNLIWKDFENVFFAWYTKGSGNSDARTVVKENFLPGGIGVVGTSFGCQKIREIDGEGCGSLLADGATATIGTVFEPYATNFPEADKFFNVFLPTSRDGFTFAESCYNSINKVPFLATCVGDPLYHLRADYETDSSIPIISNIQTSYNQVTDNKYYGKIS